MKQFNLQAAIEGKKVVTRDGREVTQLKVFTGIDTRYDSVFGIIGGGIYGWKHDGSYQLSGKSNHDLFMATEKKTVWVNVYHKFGMKNQYCADVFDYQSQAEMKKYSTYIKTVPVEIEE